MVRDQDDHDRSFSDRNIMRTGLAIAGIGQEWCYRKFGCINFVRFLQDDRVIINPLRSPMWIRGRLRVPRVIRLTSVTGGST